MNNIKTTAEYFAISEFYGDRRAERSKVLLMHHIDEGLAILNHIGANDIAKRAWCLHPIFQADKELMTVGMGHLLTSPSPTIILMVMEYRNWANQWLSEKVTRYSPRDCDLALHGRPQPGPLLEVRHMLIADKVQNYKDFLLFHKDAHERAAELDLYFKMWMKALGLSNDEYIALAAVAAATT